jgi:hypothetical protein
MRVNVRRGLFRFWLLASGLWVLGACYLGYTEYRAYQNQWHAPVDEIMVPTDCSKARGDEGSDFDRRDGHCWYTLPKLRASFTEYRDMSDYEIAKRLYVKAGVGWEDHTGRTKAIETAEWALGVPLAVFVLGWCKLWAFSGFRATSVAP